MRSDSPPSDARSAEDAPARAVRRPRVAGKALVAGRDKLHVRGFTYGPFAPNASGEHLPEPAQAERDLDAMARSGANAIRVYDVPPRWLLDKAHRAGLHVLVGIPWEQHVAFLDEPGLADAIEERVRAGVRACRGHPAVLGYAIGNEIPSSIVRWSGKGHIERHLERLAAAARAEDPRGLVTYVNYPSTEYLDLRFLDFSCFNVYLESVDRLKAYLKRLHNLAGNRPLLMGELGLDSGSHGEGGQAWGLEAQIRASFEAGCAGAFVFSWTDEWHAGGHDIDGWRFGVTRADRSPKPAQSAVRRAFKSVPVAARPGRPRITVVVCAFEAEDTLAACLTGCAALEYPDYEVIVVDDGSSDRTAAIAARFPGVRLIRTRNQGLGKARNTGIEAATGEIIAFTDADAWPDPDWLTHLALTFEETGHAGVGGPNIVPSGGRGIADCVANAPGGPVHVLLSDDEAEHIPGCNMAFRREALDRIGGFDPRFRVAGDDVDVCWEVRRAGMTLGFSPAAVVWHQARDSVRAYWRQQCGYGRAEALLEEKWPENYNTAGHVTWGGRVYGGDAASLLFGRTRIYHGIWGAAPYQSMDPGRPGLFESLATTPEWYLVLGALVLLGLLGVTWPPLLLAWPLLLLAAAPVVAGAVLGARRARFPTPARAERDGRRRRVTGFLHLVQPAARLRGRLRHGLTPWRLRAARRFLWPSARTAYVWSETWRDPASRLARLEIAVRRMRGAVLRGGPFDRWDLLIKGGFAGRVRVHLCAEEHGGGRQFVRILLTPYLSRWVLVMLGATLALAIWAAVDGAAFAAGVLAGLGAWTLVRGIQECGGALAAGLQAVDELDALEFVADTRDEGVEIRTPAPRLEPAVAAVSAAEGTAS